MSVMKTSITHADMEKLKKYMEEKKKFSTEKWRHQKEFFSDALDLLTRIENNTHQIIHGEVLELKESPQAQTMGEVFWQRVLEKLEYLKEEIKRLPTAINEVNVFLKKPEITHDLGEKFVVCGGKVCKKQSLEPIPDDEPVFIFRGRDRLAIRTLNLFDMFCKEDGATQWQLDLNQKQINAFVKFRQDHPERMKQPGITMGR